MNFTLGLLQTKHLTNSDKWKVIDAVSVTSVFDRTYMFSCIVSAGIRAKLFL